MDDNGIVELYWARSEEAIPSTAAKYGRYLGGVSYNILRVYEDAEECVNDTYLKAWNAMPPHRPSILSAFLARITRRLSIDRWRKGNAQMRGGGEVTLALDELGDCVSGRDSIEGELMQQELIDCLNCFLDMLPDTERWVFICRYWYMDSIKEICLQFGFSESKVKSMLHRTRQKLRLKLEQEGH